MSARIIAFPGRTAAPVSEQSDTDLPYLRLDQMRVVELVRAACTVCGAVWNCPSTEVETFVCMLCEEEE